MLPAWLVWLSPMHSLELITLWHTNWEHSTIFLMELPMHWYVLSVLFYRPFCKWICPLGAFYALFNKVSLFGMKVDEHKCVSCGKCAKVCKMDVDVTKTPNSTECIRCGKCISACPTEAVSFQYGFGLFRKTVDENAKIENKTNKNETIKEE